MSLIGLQGLALGAALGGSMLLLGAAIAGWRPTRGRTRHRPGTSWVVSRRTVALALAAGLVTALVTRWPVAAVAVLLTVLAWPRMFGAGPAAEAQLVRLDALATWTESLRDSIAGSIGLEEAIRHSVNAAPAVLTPHLLRLEGRLRVQLPLPQALTALAEELEDASADLVVAALVLNSRLRGPGLVATLGALAVSVREELELRRRIEEGRKTLRRTALIILASTAVFAGTLTLFSREYVSPYSTPVGQLVLAVVLAVFAAGLWWIRSATNLRTPQRFLARVESDTADVSAPMPRGGGEWTGERGGESVHQPGFRDGLNGEARR